MTLRVVADNTVPLQVDNVRDIAGMARSFANEYEAGDYGEARRVVIIIDGEDGQRIEYWGESLTQYGMIGYLESAKLHAFAASVSDDDD